ncbi:MAG: hypothetical protein CVU39_24540 [Chloroflexi bacterium HGW-Chloroflexi-10]|nr:MAG: hypothetical protein CVU39_24540 [Chloroflexi bacterium HGW-Chloroflexi-10]
MNLRRVGKTFIVCVSIILSTGCASAAAVSITPPAPSEPQPQETVVVNTPAPPETTILYEQRLISLEWPEKIRLGDSDRIQVTLEVDEFGNITPTAIYEENQITGEPILIPDLYEAYYLNIEARLDMAGIKIYPAGTTSVNMQKGKTVRLFWSISPKQTGYFRGTIWVYINMIPKEGGGPVIQEVLISKPIEIKGVSVLGMPANVTRWVGFIGATTSGFLGLPFIETLFGWLFRKLVKRYKKE